MIHDYYVKYLGTEFEGGALPWLYNKYIGHDNNRDALTMNMKDSQYVGKLMFVDWKPQAYVDHHHMGTYGARIFVPPYAEPIRPLADPQVWREMQWYGGHIAYKEEEAGLSGVLNTGQYSGWGHFGFHWITPFHNIAGMLTESASVRVATPIYIDPSQLDGGARGLETYKEQMNFPNPWPGGWWTLRGIVERQKVSAWATLDLAARNKDTVLWNAYLKASRQTDRGAKGRPAAYAMSANQHDPLTLNKLVNALLAQGIEVLQSPKGFAAPDGMTYPAGSFYVPLAQPKMGLIRYLLGETHYMDNEHTRRPDGTPIRPYDMGQDVLAEYMGIRVDPLNEAVKGDFAKVTAPIVPAGKVAANAPFGYVLDGRLNDSFRAVNLLWDKDVAVRRVNTAADGLRPGDWIVPAGQDAVLADVARLTGVGFTPLKAAVTKGVHDARRLRIGMYQRYRGGNMDEGWTRWLFEQWGFPFTQVYDAEILKGNLNAKYDVFIFADDSTGTITGEPGGGRGEGRGGAAFASIPNTTPPEYPERHRRRGRQRHQGLRAEGRHPGHAGRGHRLRHHAARAPGPQRGGGPRHEAVLLPRLDPPGEHRQHPPAGVRDAVGGPGPVPLQPGLRCRRYRFQRPEQHHRPLRRAQRRAQRMAEWREVHRRQDSHGLDRVRSGQGCAHRVPDAEPRPDTRHLQVPLQRPREPASQPFTMIEG